MDFQLNSEQTMLADSLDRFLRSNHGFARRQAELEQGRPRLPGIWKGLRDLGALALPFSEDFGGLAGSPVETMIVMRALGGALVIEPYLETIVIGASILQRSGHEQAAAVIEQIIEGDTTFALAHGEPNVRFGLADVALGASREANGWMLTGEKAAINAAPWARYLIVSARTSGKPGDRDGISLFLVDRQAATGLSAKDFATVDGGQASDLRFDAVRLPAEALIGTEGAGIDLLEPAIDAAIAALCAEAVGAMEQMLRETVDYARQRKQFGTTLSSFQVLQHKMADMFLEIEQAISITYMATLALGSGGAESSRAASAAKVRVGRACRSVGQAAIQIHGGMGMTQELAISHRFKRVSVIEQLFGGADFHLARFGHLNSQSKGDSDHA